MSDFYTIKHEADQLRKAKNYAQALPLYRQLHTEHAENCTEWEAWAFAFCLKQEKQFDEALAICRRVYAELPDFENIKGVYAWCIYYTEIAIKTVADEARFYQAGHDIMRLSKQNDQFSPYTRSVTKILDYLSQKNPYPTAEILWWTSTLNPEYLDDKSFGLTNDVGKTKQLASKKEQYYVWRTTALYKNGDYQTCIDMCEAALRTFRRFHYNNDIAFSRRIALCNKALGQPELALEQLRALLKLKNEWYLQKEIAEIYLAQGKLIEALKVAVDAALNLGEPDKKLDLFSLFAEILMMNGQREEAKKHIEFIYQLRKSNNQTIDTDLEQMLQVYGIDTEKTTDVATMHREMKQLWGKLRFTGQTPQQGTIKMILPNGKGGFVALENKKSYYFKINAYLTKQEWLAEGQNVAFYLEDGFDAKKNIPTQNATNLRPIR